MPRRWQTIALPLVGGGEQSAAAPDSFAPREASLVKNAVIGGPGLVSQQPDWLLADTLQDGAGDVEHAAVGVFPFEQKGGMSVDSQGIAFSIDYDAQLVRLHQLAEDLTVQRRYTAYSSYVQSLPPQITGVEMFGKFYFAEYARQVVAQRKGLGVFDPTGAGTVSVPTFNLNAGAAADAPLKFRGIAKHRGATLLGWGYFHEDDEDGPHVLRHCKYGQPDTWIPDATETQAGFINVGTIDVPIIGCAAAGQYTIIGKYSEIFALDGDYSSQFYYRQIGDAHGPVSTRGITTTGDLAVWMSADGPALSDQGGKVQLIGIDKLTRRFLQYMDLLTCQAEHDKRHTRVLFGLRRRFDEDGQVVTENFLTELLVWDYARHQFLVSSVPRQFWAVGTSRGPGLALAGPTGVVSNITAENITSSSADLRWTAGDPAPDVTFEVQWKPNAETEWRPFPPLKTSAGVNRLRLTNLPSDSSGILIDVRVRQVRNGQVSAYTEALALFTTTAVGVLTVPTNAQVVLTGFSTPPGTARARITWDPIDIGTGRTLIIVVYAHTADVFNDAVEIGRPLPGAGEFEERKDRDASELIYYWLQMEHQLTGAVSTEVEVQPFPKQFGDLPVEDL